MSTSTTPDVEKIAREAAEKIDYCQQDGEMGVPSLTKILRPYLAQASEPLVEALRLAEDALNTPELKHGRASQKHVTAWKAVSSALTLADTEEKI